MKRVAQFLSAIAIFATIALLAAPAASAAPNDIVIGIFGLSLDLCDLSVSILFP